MIGKRKPWPRTKPVKPEPKPRESRLSEGEMRYLTEMLIASLSRDKGGLEYSTYANSRCLPYKQD